MSMLIHIDTFYFHNHYYTFWIWLFYLWNLIVCSFLKRSDILNIVKIPFTNPRAASNNYSYISHKLLVVGSRKNHIIPLSTGYTCFNALFGKNLWDSFISTNVIFITFYNNYINTLICNSSQVVQVVALSSKYLWRAISLGHTQRAFWTFILSPCLV